MKKLTVFLSAMLLVFGVVGTANSSLTTIGTATYMGNDYNLIYEDDSIDGGLVWLDYSNSYDEWMPQVNWASGIGSSLTVNLDPDYTTDIDWSTGWRLPLTQDTIGALNPRGSEMGHLYIVTLGNIEYDDPGYGLNNTGPFENLRSEYYWSGTEYAPEHVGAWYYSFQIGLQGHAWKTCDWYALAVHSGTVSGGSIPTVPIPSAIWLLGSGLIGLVGVGRKIRKA